MKSRLAILTVASVVVLSCGIPASPPPKDDVTKPGNEGPKLIGRIASIPADKRFVLIQSYVLEKIEAGRVLTTRGPDDRTANLRITGETLGEFSAADLQAGVVEVGDAVYSQHTVQPDPISRTEEAPQTQSETSAEGNPKNN